MTDYYVIGTGHKAWGPYTLEDARNVMAAAVHYYDGEKSIHIAATTSEGYSSFYDEELPEKPPEDSRWRPWLNGRREGRP